MKCDYSIGEAEVEHFQKESWLVVLANRLRADRKENPIILLQCTYADYLDLV